MFDAALENNMFSNSVNPLLSMCLVCELCSKISKKFFSLSYPCRQAVDKVKELMIQFIQVINDENFLTTMLHEKDYSGRDTLAIVVETGLLEIIQEPKIEAVIKRIWNSNYDTSGSFFEMSTPYRILTSNSNLEDIELDNRFYKWRNIERCA